MKKLGLNESHGPEENSTDLVNITHLKRADAGKSFSRLAGTDGDFPLLASIHSESLLINKKRGGLNLDETSMTLQEALIDLYLSVKIRSNEEVFISHSLNNIDR